MKRNETVSVSMPPISISLGSVADDPGGGWALAPAPGVTSWQAQPEPVTVWHLQVPLASILTRDKEKR